MSKARERVSARNRAENHKSGFQSSALATDGDVTFFKVTKEEVRRMDFIPYLVKGEANPEWPKGSLAYERTYYVHKNVGAGKETFVCAAKTAGKRCFICEHRTELAKDPDQDEKLIKSFLPKERQLFNVIDVEDRESGVQLWDYSYHLFGKKLDTEVKNSDDDEEYEFFSDLENGLTLRVSFEEDSFGGGRPFYTAASIGFKKRDKNYTEEILEETHDLDDIIIIPKYEELKAAFLMLDEDEDSEPENAEPRREKPKSQKKETTEKKTTASESPVFAVGYDVIALDYGLVTIKELHPSGDKFRVLASDGELHVVSKDRLKHVPDSPCTACQGWGRNSKGGKCVPCGGSGEQPENKATFPDDEPQSGADADSWGDDDWTGEEATEGIVDESGGDDGGWS